MMRSLSPIGVPANSSCVRMIHRFRRQENRRAVYRWSRVLLQPAQSAAVTPKLRVATEVAREPNSRICGDAAALEHEFVDARWRQHNGSRSQHLSVPGLSITALDRCDAPGRLGAHGGHGSSSLEHVPQTVLRMLLVNAAMPVLRAGPRCGRRVWMCRRRCSSGEEPRTAGPD
jgi:hypothetical protein